jgi:hypothetical protein
MTYGGTGEEVRERVTVRANRQRLPLTLGFPHFASRMSLGAVLTTNSPQGPHEEGPDAEKRLVQPWS